MHRTQNVDLAAPSGCRPRPRDVPIATRLRPRDAEPDIMNTPHAGDPGPSPCRRQAPGTTENRGVPGSSPGLAIQIACKRAIYQFADGAQRVLSRHSIRHWRTRVRSD